VSRAVSTIISKLVLRTASLTLILILSLTIFAHVLGHARGVDEVLAFVAPSLPALWYSLFLWDGQVIVKVSEGIIDFSTLHASDASLVWVGSGDDGFDMYMWNGQEVQNITEVASSSGDSLLTLSTEGQLAWLETLSNGIYIWDGHNVLNVSDDNIRKDSLRWSRSGDLAWRSASGQIHFRIDGQEQILENARADRNSLVWSEDGHLAWVLSPDVFVWNGNEIRNITQGRGGIGSSTPKWSPNGDLAWLSVQPDGAMALNLWTGEIADNPIILADSFDTIGDPSWSADGRLVWSVQSGLDSEIYLWDGAAIVNVSHNPASDRMPVWSQDGRVAWVAYRDGNQEIYLWDGDQVQNLSQNTHEDGFAIWSEGGRLAWVTQDDSYTTISTWDGHNTRTLTVSAELFGQLNWIKWRS
jgi:hypothetical protein